MTVKETLTELLHEFSTLRPLHRYYAKDSLKRKRKRKR
jgi:hypothetical protein